jgi:hypothetical protein
MFKNIQIMEEVSDKNTVIVIVIALKIMYTTEYTTEIQKNRCKIKMNILIYDL